MFKNIKNLLINLIVLVGYIKYFNQFFFDKKNNFSIIYLHRVVIKKGLIPEIEITKDSLIKNIIFLKKRTKLISLNELVSLKKKTGLNKQYSILTFDDGYKDNLKILFPIIQRFKVPVTIYLTTRFLQGDTWMWWYQISEYLRTSDSSDFIFQEKKYSFIHNDYHKKKFFFDKIKNLLDPLSLVDQKKLCEIITKKQPRKYDSLCLNWDDVAFLNKSEFISIGCHSHSHLNLKLLKESKLDYEVNYSKELLEKKLKKKINHFAFPYGSKAEVGFKTIKKVFDSGFKTAVTTEIFDYNYKKNFLLNRFSIDSDTTLGRLNIKIFGLENSLKKYINS